MKDLKVSSLCFRCNWWKICVLKSAWESLLNVRIFRILSRYLVCLFSFITFRSDLLPLKKTIVAYKHARTRYKTKKSMYIVVKQKCELRQVNSGHGTLERMHHVLHRCRAIWLCVFCVRLQRRTDCDMVMCGWSRSCPFNLHILFCFYSAVHTIEFIYIYSFAMQANTSLLFTRMSFLELKMANGRTFSAEYHQI